MFPIRDHNPSRRTPFVTYVLLGLNVLIFLGYAGAFDQPQQVARIFYTYGVVPGEVSRGQGLVTLVTSMFLHGGWMHLIGNMLYLWVFGDNIEDELGPGPFLAFYLAGGIGAALAQVIADPASQVPMVGASGAIAAVLGGYILMYPKARVDVLFIIVILIRIVPIPAWIVLGVWFALQIVSGAIVAQDGGGVAYWAHAGGFLAGVLLMVPHWLRRGGPAYWTQTGGHPDHPETRYSARRTSIPSVRRRR